MAVVPAVADAFVIEGARPLTGRIRAAGNKNGALPILAACLLTDEPVTLANVPRIRDVETMVELLADLGADVAWTGPNEVRVHTADVSSSSPDERLCRRIRASFLLAGPLLARFGSATMPLPGGDVIGRRRLDPHMHAFAELGAEIDVNGRYAMRTDGLRSAQVFLDEASVMATENTVMAAVLTPGQTVLGNAACEPHVQDLCRFLVSLGAQIEGIESNVLRITGVERLRGGTWSIGPDHIEVGSFVGMAAITGGAVTIEGVEPKDLVAIVFAFQRLGVEVEVRGDSVHVPTRQQLVVRDDLGGMIPKIEDGPWPAFPSDLTSIAITIATQAFGTVLMFEKMFENRLFFTDKLVSIGADIDGIESNVLRIRGVDSLRGGAWRIGPDHMEVGSFVGLAAMTRGYVTIESVEPKDLVSILPVFERLGVRVEVGETTLRVPPDQELVIRDDLHGQIPKIEDGPWPAFPSDLTPIALTVATQARGTILIFEKMFENRLFFTDKLVSMGARIILCDPHRVVVTGPARLYGQRMESPDIRAGMSMLLASLCADGASTIGAVYQIDKGYERIDERLRLLGARIERVEG